MPYKQSGNERDAAGEPSGESYAPAVTVEACRSLALSVIVPVRDGGQELAQCVAALLKSSVRPTEILIVDDGSRAALPEIVKQAPCRVIRSSQARGSFHARNEGAREARGDVLVFIDSDVCVSDGTLEQIQGRLAEDDALAAVFGRYDEEPSNQGFVSQYRNLLHSFVHRSGNPRASTFWTGCGGIRREVFWEFGGFSLNRSHLRDVELGVRLWQAGRVLLLDRTLEVKHLKRWTLADVVRTDIFYRGANWTEICLRTKYMPNDLNLRMSERFSVVAVYLLAISLAAGMWAPIAAWLPAAVALLAGYLYLSRRFLSFLWRAKGLWFAARAVPLHMVYHLCCGAGFVIGASRWLSGDESSGGSVNSGPFGR